MLSNWLFLFRVLHRAARKKRCRKPIEIASREIRAEVIARNTASLVKWKRGTSVLLRHSMLKVALEQAV